MENFVGTKEEIEKISKDVLEKEIVEFIEKRKKEKNFESNLIEVLHMVQEKWGYLEEAKLKAVSYLMNIPIAKITGVATFYHFFTLKEDGKYVIEVCMGTACHVKKAEDVVKKIKEELGIDFNETTKDGLFSLKSARCLGMCALAPVLKINDKIYQNVTPLSISKILATYS